MILTKTIVRFLRYNGIPATAKPARLLIRIAVKLRYIRFDIQKRSSIKHVNIFNDESAVFYGNEPHNRKTYCVRATGSTCGKDTMGYRVKKRGNGQLAGIALVERIDKDNPGEAVEISKPFHIFTEYFNGPLNTPRSDWLDRHPGNEGERGMDCTDRSIGDPGNRMVDLFHPYTIPFFPTKIILVLMQKYEFILNPF